MEKPDEPPPGPAHPTSGERQGFGAADGGTPQGPDHGPDGLERAGAGPGGSDPGDDPGSDPGDDLDEVALETALSSNRPDAEALEVLDGDGEQAEEAVEATAPAVVAVVVTSDGPDLEGALSSLAAQDYPALSILVLDSGSAADPTPRIASVAPRAFVRRLSENVGFAVAANEALSAVEGAAFLLFCHDDVVLDEGAVRVMVEEAYRSNAGIVGPKIVDRDRPEVLLEVGLAIDHYGVPFSGIEPGELDQEQHDAVRDVFFVSSAVMLVRADLFTGLRGFDPDTYPGADDLDLCWRARLAGARILVVPDARVAHGRSGVGPAREEPIGDERRLNRNRIRVLLKSYSGIALIWVIPAAFLLNVLESAAFVATRRFGRARAVLGGWWANLRDLRGVIGARRQTQALRTVGDTDVRELMVRGSARIRTFLMVRLHAGDRISDVSVRTRAAVSEARSRVTRPEAVAGAALLAVLAFGARGLVTGRVAAIGSFGRWPGLGGLLGAYWDPWRHAGLGVDTPAPPLLALLGALTTALLGDAALARTVVVAGALPIGAVGCYKLLRRMSPSAWPAVAAAGAYAANPVARNAVARGRLGPCVLFALAPFLLAALVRVADSSGSGLGMRDVGGRRTMIAMAALSAVVTAAWPPAALALPVGALALLVAAPLVGGWGIAARAAGAAAAGSALSLVLLLPWPLVLLNGDAATLGLVPRASLGLSDVLRFHTGPAGAGWAPWGLYVAAALPLVVATGPRLAWAGRAWMLTMVSLALAWLPGRLDADLSVPVADGVLVPAALGLALATGLGVAAFVDDLRQFLFGWRQIAAVAAAFGLGLPLLGLLPDTIGGRYRLPDRDWGEALSWMEQEKPSGSFRVLWLGDPDVLPLDARRAAGVGYGLTVNGVGDVRSLAPPAGDGEEVLEEAMGLLGANRTARVGHLLAPMGVRYVALVSRAAPGKGAQAPPDERFVQALGSQLDLAVLESERGMLLYENEAWSPMRAIVAESGADLVPLDSEDPLAASAGAELSEAKALRGPVGGSAPAGPGLLLWAEGHDARWRAESDGRPLEHVQPFGWSNGFVVPERGAVSIDYDGGLTRPALLLLQAGAWVLLGLAWWRERRGSAVPGKVAEAPDAPDAGGVA